MVFFSSRRRHTRYWRDWSSDVCSSDLHTRSRPGLPGRRPDGRRFGLHHKRHPHTVTRPMGRLRPPPCGESRIGKEHRMAASEGKKSAEKDLSGPARLALKLGSGAHAGVYRATGGKLFGRMGKSPILLLNTVGRKSGKRRTSPLLYVMDGEDFVVIASKGGAATHPAWYLNLMANPGATVEIGDREARVEAEEAAPAI